MFSSFDVIMTYNIDGAEEIVLKTKKSSRIQSFARQVRLRFISHLTSDLDGIIRLCHLMLKLWSQLKFYIHPTGISEKLLSNQVVSASTPIRLHS